MLDVPFGVTLSLSGVRKELGKTDGESNEKARFGVFGCLALYAPPAPEHRWIIAGLSLHCYPSVRSFHSTS